MSTLDLAFAALADPTRRKLLQRVGLRPQPVVELCDGFAMSQPAISKHLRVLRVAGLVELEKHGREHIYRLSPGGIKDVNKFIETISAMWDETLQTFAQYVEDKE